MLKSFLAAAAAGEPEPTLNAAARNDTAASAARKRVQAWVDLMAQSSLSVRRESGPRIGENHRRQSWRPRSPGLLSRRAPGLYGARAAALGPVAPRAGAGTLAANSGVR